MDGVVIDREEVVKPQIPGLAVSWGGMITQKMEEHQNIKRIMVVDDEPGALALIRIMLERSGFAVLGARDAAEALKLLEASTPDLFVLDVMMPDVDGIELCRQIRARPQTARTPIIILSARSDQDAIAEGFEAGADDYLLKPILHSDLATKAQGLLDL